MLLMLVILMLEPVILWTTSYTTKIFMRLSTFLPLFVRKGLRLPLYVR